ncbi:MAG: phosphotransferase family protein [Actinomycetota bacterium]|nr:phosphotransferase family protein [Actinomycetota bacterium]
MGDLFVSSGAEEVLSTGNPEDPFPGLIRPIPLRGWFDDKGLGSGLDITFERVRAGESNEVFVVRRGRDSWVLRRPSAVPLSFDGANRIMEREFRFQSALEGTLVPHARPLALCEDSAVTGAVFYVMEHVDGLLPLDPLPDEIGGPSAARRVAEELVDALAELASIDYAVAGLADLGKPDGFLERQVGRWRGQLESYRNRELPGCDQVAEWLERNRPTVTVPGVMHGDYNRHNALFSREKPTRLLAVLDWENATIGDPLMDLGYLIGSWDPGDSSLPGRAEAVARWTERTGRRPECLGWYAVMSKFKLACMLEGVYVRQQSDHTRVATGYLGDVVLGLVDEALRLIPAASDW